MKEISESYKMEKQMPIRDTNYISKNKPLSEATLRKDKNQLFRISEI